MRFSVVVPVYNKVAYVERTLRSVLSQTICDYELIVVDDGSTDGSVDVVRDLVGRDTDKVRVVEQVNAGVAAARNNGVALASGEYVCFLDADDWWEPTFLQEMDELIASYPDAGLYGTNFFLVKNGRKRVAPIGLEEGFQSGYINYCKVYAKTLCMPISSSSVAVPRKVLDAVGQFRSGIKIGEDFDLWIRIALKYPVALVNKPLAYYFQDLPAKNRATRNLVEPGRHMLWNLDYLEEEVSSNEDLKVLMDRLRASGLYRFYLSKQYHEDAVAQLERIDWNNVPEEVCRIYHSSLFVQRCRFMARSMAAKLKQQLLRSIDNRKN